MRGPWRAVRGAAALVAVVTLAAAGTVPARAVPAGPDVGTAGAAQRADPGLLERIRGLDIVLSAKRVPAAHPYRAFRVRVAVPADHDDPDGPTFPLRLTLLHRSTDAPMVLHTSGYYSWLRTGRDEVTRIVGGNQIDLEHRFFPPSRPVDPDWHRQLTIRQAAADEHLVVEAFRQVYDGAWLTTGASKGGMTATYHRHFYPDDVDGTVAFVAPNDADDDEDSAYAEFLATVGGDALADCRGRLVGVQRAVLTDRGWFEERLARKWGTASFDVVGGVGAALEIAVEQRYWTFWQYGKPRDCRTVPDAGATRRELWEFTGLAFGAAPTRTTISHYLPYYFQAATQIGYPATYLEPIADLVRHPDADRAENYVPDRLHPLEKDPTAMAAVDAWVRTEASEMLFVDGELDPWSAEPFDCGAADDARDCVRFTVPGGNHGASIRRLPPADRAAAVARIRSWAGLPTVSARTVLDPAGERWIPELDDPWLEWVENGRREAGLPR